MQLSKVKANEDSRGSIVLSSRSQVVSDSAWRVPFARFEAIGVSSGEQYTAQYSTWRNTDVLHVAHHLPIHVL